MSTTSAPKGYEVEPTDNSIYLKIEPNSSIRIRLASEPIMFIDTFQDGSKSERWGWAVILKTPAVKQGDPPIKTVKAFKAGVMIYKAIRALAMSEEWGDPQGYDLTISRTGSGKEGTKYTVIPSPAKPMNDEDRALIAAANLDLGALFIKLPNAPPSAPDEHDPYADE